MDSAGKLPEMCFIGNHLAKTTSALNELLKCDETVLTKFVTLDPELRKTILARVCISHIVEDAVICDKHIDFLGPKFATKMNAHKRCLWPHHSGKSRFKTSGKGLQNAFTTVRGDVIKQSFFLYSNYAMVVPFEY